MRRFSLLAVTAVAVAALGTTVAAQGRSAGKAPTKGPSVGAQAPKGGGPSAQGASTTKARATNSGTTTKASGAAHGAGKKVTTTTASTSTGTSSGSSTSTTTASVDSTTTTTPTTTVTFEPNAISTKLSKNPSQLARVKGMLPTGMTIEEASTGFRNQGQFMAALNASKNRGIDFVQLKEAMTVDGMSLGQAAKQIRTAPAPALVTTETGSTTSVSVSASTGSTTVSGSTTTTSGTTTAPAAQ